jgi:hypothetical protein
MGVEAVGMEVGAAEVGAVTGAPRSLPVGIRLYAARPGAVLAAVEAPAGADATMVVRVVAARTRPRATRRPCEEVGEIFTLVSSEPQPRSLGPVGVVRS